MSSYARKMKRNVDKLVNEQIKRLSVGKKILTTRIPCPYTPHVMCDKTNCQGCDTYEEVVRAFEDTMREGVTISDD